MKICIPTINDNGMDSKVNLHFGSSPFFMIYDNDSEVFEFVDNSDAGHEHGMCRPLSQIGTKNIDTVICSGMGARAISRLNQEGIRAFKSHENNLTAREVVSKYEGDELTEITVEDACQNHNCH